MQPARDLPGDPADQARTPLFRALLFVQVLAAGLFGLVPYLAPDASANLSGFVGGEPFIYRLAAAASLGYAVAAALALAHSRWHRVRIPMVATLVFNLSAMVAALFAIGEGIVSSSSFSSWSQRRPSPCSRRTGW